MAHGHTIIYLYIQLYVDIYLRASLLFSFSAERSQARNLHHITTLTPDNSSTLLSR